MHIGDILADRYEILCKLGYGSSSPDTEMNESEYRLSDLYDGESSFSEDDEVISDSEDILAKRSRRLWEKLKEK